MLNSDPKMIGDLGRKLRVMSLTFQGVEYKLFRDEYKKGAPQDLGRIRRQLVYRIWFRCRRAYGEVVSLEDLIAF